MLELAFYPLPTKFSSLAKTNYATIQRCGGILPCSCQSVSLSVRLLVSRPFLVGMRTIHRIYLSLSNLAQTCISECRRFGLY